MKRIHIIILVLIAVAIAVMVSFMGSLSTYETIASAKQKEGKTVTIIAKLDNSQPIEFDAQKNPNYTSFHIMDTLGNKTRVVYYYEKPFDMEKAERLVISEATVRNHLTSIFAKLGVDDRFELVVFAYQNQLAQPPP